MDGLPSTIKESVGEYNSTKDIWLKLEREYQNGRQDIEKMNQETEDKPPEDVKEKKELDSNEGMDSFYCNTRICDEIEYVLAKDDKDLSKATKEITHLF